MMSDRNVYPVLINFIQTWNLKFKWIPYYFYFDNTKSFSENMHFFPLSSELGKIFSAATTLSKWTSSWLKLNIPKIISPAVQVPILSGSSSKTLDWLWLFATSFSAQDKY